MVIKVYISGMSGNKEVKKRQQRVTMIMDSKHIEYTVIDITEPGQEAEKDFMQTNAQHKGCTISDPNPRHALPPQLFNDTEYCGDYDDFDMANEVDNLEVFLKLAAPEAAEHKNGTILGDGATEEEATAAPAAADDDEDKENKTEDNTAGGADGEAAADEGTNEAEAEVVEGKDVSAKDTSIPEQEGAEADADEASNENTDKPTTTTVEQEDDGETVEKERRPAEDDKHGESDNTEASEAAEEKDVSEETEPTVESTVVGVTEASKADDVDTSIQVPNEQLDDGDLQISQSKDDENDDVPLAVGDDGTTANDEMLKEDTLPLENVNQEQHVPTAVSVENDTDTDVTNEKPTNNQETIEAGGDETETSDGDEDSQQGNDISRPYKEENLNQRQQPTAVDLEEKEDVLRIEDSSREVDRSPSLDEQMRDGGTEEGSSKSDNAKLTVEPTESVPVDKDSLATEKPSSVDRETSEIEDKSEADENSTKTREHESIPVGPGSVLENSSTPTPLPTDDVEDPRSAVEMDADPDDEEQELLKQSAALAGKSEDAEEIDIAEDAEEEEDEDEDEAAQADAGEDGISSKLVDTDDPMVAEQEQEE